MKAQYIIVQNIRALLVARGAAAKDLAFFAGHQPAWLSKILSGERGIQCEDVDKIADFFGLTAADMFSYGIAPLLERRKAERRVNLGDRRQGERRQGSDAQRLYRQIPPWRPKPKPPKG